MKKIILREIMEDKMDIKNELKNFAEDNKAEMSVNVYNGIWNIIQSIEQGEG